MRQAITLSDGGRPTGHFRNTAYVINESRAHFDAAMQPGSWRSVRVPQRDALLRWAWARLNCRTNRFVRCSYLELDNHPVIVAGAIEAIQAHRSVHWSCARTRLNFDLLAELEDSLTEMFGARVLAFSSVMLANLGAMPILASGQLTGGRKPVVALIGWHTSRLPTTNLSWPMKPGSRRSRTTTSML